MPDFPPLDFDQFNEADVRGEVIDPLMRQLGYKAGTRHNIIREQHLLYPRRFLGRKDLSKDPILRGKADYILEADRRVRWVIEAKAPSDTFKQDDIEQAWTYASHAEVRAVYFSLCNGRALNVFQTNLAPSVEPVLVVPYEEFAERFEEICDRLLPDSVLRDHPTRERDIGPPLGPGLRSVVRIASGLIRYDQVAPPMIGSLADLQFFIVGGAVERDEKGRLVALVTTQAPLRSVQEINERLGLASIEMESEATTLSTDPARPTVFRSARVVSLPAGSKLPDILRGRTNLLSINLTVETNTLAMGSLSKRRFSGRFAATTKVLESGLEIEMAGPFEIHLA